MGSLGVFDLKFEFAIIGEGRKTVYSGDLAEFIFFLYAVEAKLWGLLGNLSEWTEIFQNNPKPTHLYLRLIYM